MMGDRTGCLHMGQAGDGGGQHGSNARGRCGMVGTVWEKRKEDTKVTDSVIRFFTCHQKSWQGKACHPCGEAES